MEAIPVVRHDYPCACGKPVPCYQNPPCTNLVNGPVVLPALGTVPITTETMLLSQLLKEGGVVINATACSAHEVAEAKAEGRTYRDPRGYTFVLMTPEWLEHVRKLERANTELLE